MMYWTRHMILIGLALSFIRCNDDPVLTDIDLDAEILKEMEDHQIPSVVACVVKGNEIVWQGTYGFADAGQSIAVNERTLYALQSISKLFLATSVMQLWEKDMLDLDEDINQYLPFEVRNPNFPDLKITPHMLMTHSSGLAWPHDNDRIPDFHHFYPLDEMPLISEWLPEFILPSGSSYRDEVWKRFAPGSQYLYSNIGTSLLALVVENITGQDYRDYVQENLLIPLEMDNSGFRFSNLNEDLLATPFYDNGFPMHQFNLRHYPIANLKSNLQDFSHFIAAFLNRGEFNGKRILESSTIDKMFEIQNPASGGAYLWWHCLGDCIGHNGGGTGFSTRFELYLENNKGIIILTNKVNNSVYAKGRIHELVRYQSTLY